MNFNDTPEESAFRAEIRAFIEAEAPKNTPREIVMKLNEVVRAALKDEKVRTRLKELAANVPAENEQTPEWLGAFVRSEVDKWTPIIRQTGARME